MTTGMYGNGDLVAGAKRLAMIVSGQELYYPRPHQTDIYKPFKLAYQTEVEHLVRDAPQSSAAAAIQAADAFFVQFEALDEAKVERRNRRRLGKLAL